VIKITMKNGEVFDRVEETEKYYFYVGKDGYTKFIKKYKVDKVETILHKKEKHKTSLLFNIIFLILIIMLILGELK